MTRRLHHSVLADVGVGGDAPHVAGAGTGAEAESWSCRSLEKSEMTCDRSKVSQHFKTLTAAWRASFYSLVN